MINASPVSSEYIMPSLARILVVDDNSLNRKKMRMAVETLGHEVETAENGAAALELLNRGDFDAVLLDIIIPEIDGFDVLGALKADVIQRDISSLWSLPSMMRPRVS